MFVFKYIFAYRKTLSRPAATSNPTPRSWRTQAIWSWQVSSRHESTTCWRAAWGLMLVFSTTRHVGRNGKTKILNSTTRSPNVWPTSWTRPDGGRFQEVPASIKLARGLEQAARSRHLAALGGSRARRLVLPELGRQ